MEKKQEVRTQLRLPAEVHDWVANQAKENYRSMNREIVRALVFMKEMQEKGAFKQTA
jgi:hypothetical protein